MQGYWHLLRHLLRQLTPHSQLCFKPLHLMECPMPALLVLRPLWPASLASVSSFLSSLDSLDIHTKDHSLLITAELLNFVSCSHLHTHPPCCQSCFSVVLLAQKLSLYMLYLCEAFVRRLSVTHSRLQLGCLTVYTEQASNSINGTARP